MSGIDNWSIDSADRVVAKKDKEKIREVKKLKHVKERLKKVTVLSRTGEVIRIIQY